MLPTLSAQYIIVYRVNTLKKKIAIIKGKKILFWPIDTKDKDKFMYKNTECDRDKIYYTCSKTKKQCI